MAKASSPIVRDDFPLDLGFVEVPAHVLRDLAPIDATGSGIILSDAGIKFRLNRADGAPVEYTASVTVKRTPLDDGEARRVTIAKELQQAKKAERDQKSAESVQRIAERAKADGRAESAKEAEGFRDGLKSAVTMLPALSEMARAMASHTKEADTK